MINNMMKINTYIFEYEIQLNKINFKLNHNIKKKKKKKKEIKKKKKKL